MQTQDKNGFGGSMDDRDRCPRCRLRCPPQNLLTDSGLCIECEDEEDDGWDE